MLIFKDLTIQTIQTTVQDVIWDKNDDALGVKIDLEGIPNVPNEKSGILILTKIIIWYNLLNFMIF